MLGFFKKKPASIYELPFGEKSQEEVRELAESLANQIRRIVDEGGPGSSRRHHQRASLMIEEAAFNISGNMFDRVKIWNAVERVNSDAYQNLIAAIQNPGHNNCFASSR